jgi:hypothetical protein
MLRSQPNCTPIRSPTAAPPSESVRGMPVAAARFPPHVDLDRLGVAPVPCLVLAFSGCPPGFIGLDPEHLSLIADLPGLLTPREQREDRGGEGENGEDRGGHGGQLHGEDLGHDGSLDARRAGSGRRAARHGRTRPGRAGPAPSRAGPAPRRGGGATAPGARSRCSGCRVPRACIRASILDPGRLASCQQPDRGGFGARCP